jgi:succinate dehydrogenase / fumarate reductase cytochrome b subunit
MSAASPRPFFMTSVGKKFLMGISGLVWVGFVAAHMAGNLLIFVGADAYNQYGHFLTSGYFIYVAEAVLVAALLTHILCAISLTLENRAARPQRYAMTPNGDKGVAVASRFMAVHGTIILVFIISHLATFKYGTYYQTTVNGIVMRDLHRLMIEVFQQPIYVVWYVVALVLLAAHLSHGVGSIFQSLGLFNQRMAPTIKKISWAYAAIVLVGFLSTPIYVYFFVG